MRHSSKLLVGFTPRIEVYIRRGKTPRFHGIAIESKLLTILYHYFYRYSDKHRHEFVLEQLRTIFESFSRRGGVLAIDLNSDKLRICKHTDTETDTTTVFRSTQVAF